MTTINVHIGLALENAITLPVICFKVVNYHAEFVKTQPTSPTMVVKILTLTIVLAGLAMEIVDIFSSKLSWVTIAKRAVLVAELSPSLLLFKH